MVHPYTKIQLSVTLSHISYGSHCVLCITIAMSFAFSKHLPTVISHMYIASNMVIRLIPNILNLKGVGEEIDHCHKIMRIYVTV